ncbi:DHA2 family efflux MFS transporter permease subunit [Sporolactobacillus shoreae]|uniref:DHA2 family efflux MFS transporter permease subunit n=1 Tax=Sporolactobacillus shoreae TaxID=1465501 RepID=A0A4Z0GMP8_9BACL|nr:DHA2 family efflux MFS transporter permease subunit [Sporolactobacillus shoreae]TGA97484.1 DHA2 family efflux MFS transporter permease subunit [Sporolactobacillus shoreae]
MLFNSLENSKRHLRITKWMTLGVTCLGLMLLNIDTFIVNVALPSIGEDMHASVSIVSWVVSVYVLMLGALPAGFGRIGDILGQKRFYIGGLFLFTLASTACGLAPNMGWFIVSRAFQGIGAAAITPGTLALLIPAFPKKQRGLAIGLNGGIGGLGLVLGPFLGGIITSALGWRWIFFVNIPIGLSAILLTIIFVVENQHLEKTRKIDWLGMLYLSIGLFPILYAFTRSENDGFDPVASVAVLIGLGIIGLFVFEERRTKDPLISLSLLKNTAFTMPCISLFLFSAALFGSQPYWSLFFQNFWGFSALEGGVALLPTTVLIALLTPFLGIMIQKHERNLRYIVMLGVFLVGISFLFTVLLSKQSNYLNTFLPSMLIRGIGIPILMTSISLSIMNAVPEKKAGLAAGMYNMSRNIGTSIGVSLLGQVYTYKIYTKLSVLYNDLPRRRAFEIESSACQFIKSNGHMLKKITETAIMSGFANLSLICALAFIPALISAFLIKERRD